MTLRLTAIATVSDSELIAPEFARLLATGSGSVDSWVIVHRTYLDPVSSNEKVREVANHHLLEPEVEVVTVEPCGVSRARNAGIERFELISNLGDWVCFPDDDCEFPDAFRVRFETVVDSEDFSTLILPYGPKGGRINRQRWPARSFWPTPRQLLGLVSSIGIFVRREGTVQRFDEDYGVGAKLRSAEDVDFVLRLVGSGCRVFYQGGWGMLHEYREGAPDRIVGNIAVTAAHCKLVGPIPFARALLRGGKLAFAGVGRSMRSVLPLEATASSEAFRSVAGLRFSSEEPSKLVRTVAGIIASPREKPQTVVAAHVTALNAAHDPAFIAAYNSADFSMVDGISLSVLSMLTPGGRLKKMATTDFAPQLVEYASQLIGRRLRVAIVGGDPGVAELSARELERGLPVDVVYEMHGYRDDTSLLIEEVNGAEPDLLFLGLGMPLEAFWLQRHVHALRVPVTVTCGGWLRLLAGLEQRAPSLMRRLQLEWLWRWTHDPVRTSQRYRTGVAGLVRAALGGWRN